MERRGEEDISLNYRLIFHWLINDPSHIISPTSPGGLRARRAENKFLEISLILSIENGGGMAGLVGTGASLMLYKAHNSFPIPSHLLSPFWP